MKLLRISTSVFDWLNRAGATLGMVGVVIMMLLIVVEVTGRKLLSYSTLVSDELTGYLLVLVVFMGLGFTLKEGEHIQVKILVERVSQRGRDWLTLGWCILGLVLTVLLAYRSLAFALQSYKIGTVSTTILVTPLYLPQSVMFIGLSLLLLQFITDFIAAVRSLRT